MPTQLERRTATVARLLDATEVVVHDRGYADTCLEKAEAALALDPEDAARYRAGEIELPPWFGRDDVHLSHRSKLVEKDPEHYAPLFPDTLPGLDYVWPVTG